MDLKFFFAPIICYQLIPSLLFTCISNSFLFILYPWWGWDVILKSIFVTPQFAWLFNIGCLYLFCYPASACAPFWLFLSFSHISGLSSALYPSHRDLTSDGVNAANADLAILCLFLHYVTLLIYVRSANLFLSIKIPDVQHQIYLWCVSWCPQPNSPIVTSFVQVDKSNKEKLV